MEIKQFILHSHSVVLQREIIRVAGTAYAHAFYQRICRDAGKLTLGRN